MATQKYGLDGLLGVYRSQFYPLGEDRRIDSTLTLSPYKPLLFFALRIYRSWLPSVSCRA